MLITRAFVQRGSRHECKCLDPDFESHAMRPKLRGRAACSCCLFLQRTTSRNKPRAGWLRSLYNLFGLGKRQEAASILAAVNAATPVGHIRADRAGTRRWTRGSIEREDLAL